MAGTKSRSVCQDVYRQPQPLVSLSPSKHCPREVIDGGFTKTILPKNPPLSPSSSKSLDQFQTSLCGVFYERFFFAFWASICLCFVGLCTEARYSQECQTLKVFTEIYGNSVCYILSHPSVLMIPRFNQQETQLMFRMKLDINHDRKM